MSVPVRVFLAFPALSSYFAIAYTNAYAMPKQMISLKDAVFLTGKNESTIRRHFKNPKNSKYITVDESNGKIYIDRNELIRKYPPIQTPKQTPIQEPMQTPMQEPVQPTYVPDYTEVVNLLKAQVEDLKKDKAMLKEQLAIKDLQLTRAEDRANYFILQQNNPKKEQQKEQKQKVTSEQASQPEQKPRSWFKRIFS